MPQWRITRATMSTMSFKQKLIILTIHWTIGNTMAQNMPGGMVRWLGQLTMVLLFWGCICWRRICHLGTIRKKRCWRWIKEMGLLKIVRKGVEVDEGMQAGDGNQDESFEDIPGQSEVLITYVDQKFAFVVLQASPRDFLQLIGVDDPKQDCGEVIKVDMFSCDWLMGWVSIIYHNCFSYILSLRNPTRCHWIICNASILVIVNPSILRLGKKWSFGLGRVHGGAMLEQPRTITQFSTHFRLCSPQWLWPSMLKNCGLSKYSFKRLDKWLEIAYFFSSGRDGQYTCINHQHSLPLKITHTINISTALTFTERFTTPLPDDIPTESTPSGFDVVPGETSFSREPTAIDFLAEAWAKSLSLSHHFWLVFLTGHIDSAMIGHTCMTICPSGFATINDKITIMYTNKFGWPHTESILCHHLALHSPKKVMSTSSFWGDPRQESFAMWRRLRVQSVPMTWWLLNRSS